MICSSSSSFNHSGCDQYVSDFRLWFKYHVQIEQEARLTRDNRKEKVRMTRFISRIVIACLLTSTVGCKSGAGGGGRGLGLGGVRVVKNPGAGDGGIRFYRPKPYLLVEPADPLGRMVKLKVEQLPDYSEEYSIHPRGQSSVQLKDGWNLVSAGAGGGGGGGDDKKDAAAAPAPAGDLSKMPEMVVAANNVPIGYYESVFDTVGTKKYLKGWRYIGFAVNGGGSPNGVQQGQPGMPGGPDPSCPPPPGSSVDGPLYGLVFFNGVMTFREIGEIAGNLMCPTYVSTPKSSVVEAGNGNSVIEPGPRSNGSGVDGGESTPPSTPNPASIPSPPSPSTPSALSVSSARLNGMTSPNKPSDHQVNQTSSKGKLESGFQSSDTLLRASEISGIPLPKGL